MNWPGRILLGVGPPIASAGGFSTSAGLRRFSRAVLHTEQLLQPFPAAAYLIGFAPRPEATRGPRMRSFRVSLALAVLHVGPLLTAAAGENQAAAGSVASVKSPFTLTVIAPPVADRSAIELTGKGDNPTAESGSISKVTMRQASLGQ
jgi:hypothetical protein